MPKMKTHCGEEALQGHRHGKLRRQQANRRHLFEHKASTRTRRLAWTPTCRQPTPSRVRKLLGR